MHIKTCCFQTENDLGSTVVLLGLPMKNIIMPHYPTAIAVDRIITMAVYSLHNSNSNLVRFAPTDSLACSRDCPDLKGERLRWSEP